MESLIPVLIGIGIAVAALFILWLIFKDKKKSDIILQAVSLGANFTKTVMDLLIKDPIKKKVYKDYVDLLLVGVIEVEKSKTDIQAKMLKEGWDEADRTKLHDAYTQEAIRIAKKYAELFGVVYDGFSEGMMITVVKLFLGFFKQPDPQVVEINLGEIIRNQASSEDKVGPFSIVGTGK